jgi:hypothetical protein
MRLNNVKNLWTTGVTVAKLSRGKDSEFQRIFYMQIDDDLLHYLVMVALLAILLLMMTLFPLNHFSFSSPLLYYLFL